MDLDQLFCDSQELCSDQFGWLAHSVLDSRYDRRCDKVLEVIAQRHFQKAAKSRRRVHSYAQLIIVFDEVEHVVNKRLPLHKCEGLVPLVIDLVEGLRAALKVRFIQSPFGEGVEFLAEVCNAFKLLLGG